jgi:hypothetical protein
LLLKLQKRIL